MPAQDIFWVSRLYSIYASLGSTSSLASSKQQPAYPLKCSELESKFCFAERLSCGVAVDAFGGVGGNSVQLARSCRATIVTDLSMERLLLAKHNAGVYGVSHKLDFVCGDFLKMAPHFQVGLQRSLDNLSNNCCKTSFCVPQVGMYQ